MYWSCDPYEKPSAPRSIVDAVRQLEDALDVITRGMSAADRLNREEPDPPDDPSVVQEVRLSERPERPPQQKSGTLTYRWEGNSVITWPSPLQGCKPQTIFTRVKTGKWEPGFHVQVLENLTLAIQYLAPICEKAGWSADPFDRLLAWGVETIPVQDKKNLQDAYTLIAKLRRRHGLVGENLVASSDAHSAEAEQSPEGRRGRKRRRTAPVKPLTQLQQQALELYAEHNGRIMAIARAMKVKHPTVHQHLAAAWRKLPHLMPQHGAPRGRTRRLPTDHRNQTNL